jgi:hypothetical protein
MWGERGERGEGGRRGEKGVGKRGKGEMHNTRLHKFVSTGCGNKQKGGKQQQLTTHVQQPVSSKKLSFVQMFFVS